jgi:hypothetical protein
MQKVTKQRFDLFEERIVHLIKQPYEYKALYQIAQKT